MTIRTRLTLLYAGILAASLAFYGLGVVLVLQRHEYVELDQRLHDYLDSAVQRAEMDASGRLTWRAPERAHPHAEEEHWPEFWTETGELILSSPLPESLDLGPPPHPDGVRWAPRTFDSPLGPVRVMTARVEFLERTVLVRIAASEDLTRHELGELLRRTLQLFLVVVGIATLGGYALTTRLLTPLGEMARQARRISAERLSERLPVRDPRDELGHLASAFNETFGRLETSFERLRRFTADASHELRTPLTALRSVGEVGLREGRAAGEYREVIGSMLEETDRLTRLVDRLLFLSRADAGQVRPVPEMFDAAELVQQVIDQLSVLAEERNQSLTAEARGDTWLKADPNLLRQALMNLIDNAIKYSPEGSRVHVVTAAAADVEVCVAVCDEGPGIPAEHRDRIFDRFSRVDEGRSKSVGGAGLGLSLARWVVECQGGRLELEKGGDSGSVFCIRMPR